MRPTLLALALAAMFTAWSCADDPQPPADDGPEAPECLVDAECPADEHCVRGRCEPIPQCTQAPCPCFGDGDCPPRAVCDTPTGLCIDLGCRGPQDCAPGEVCQQGECAPRPPVQDRDDDGVEDDRDNCPDVANPTQDDRDRDGVGDACERDTDRDGVKDALDNCPGDANTNQLDADRDGQGDVCDDDDDGDGVPDEGDLCPLVADPAQRDADGDGVGDLCDEDWGGVRLTGRLGLPEGADPGPARLALAPPEGDPHETTVAPDGGFVFEGLRQEGLHRLTLRWEGWQLATQEPLEIEVGLDEEVIDIGLLEVAALLPPGLTLEARFSPDWLPPTARVGVVTLTRDGATLTRDIAEGTPERFEALEAGTWVVRLTRDGFTDAVDTVALADSLEAHHLTLAVTLEDLDDAALDLSGVTLDRTAFEGLIDDGVRVRGADLSGVILTGDLSGLGLDLSSVSLVEATITSANLSGVTMSLADLSRIDGAGVAMADAALTGATLTGASLAGADLSGATLNACDLTDADLSGVSLAGASLLGATVTGARFEGATFDDATICPDGRTHAQHPGCGLLQAP